MNSDNEGIKSDIVILNLVYQTCKTCRSQSMNHFEKAQFLEGRFCPVIRKRAFSTSETSQFDSTRGRRLRSIRTSELKEQNTLRNDSDIEDTAEEIRNEYTSGFKDTTPPQFEFQRDYKDSENKNTGRKLTSMKTNNLNFEYDLGRSHLPGRKTLIKGSYPSVKPTIGGKENASDTGLLLNRKSKQQCSRGCSDGDLTLISSLPHNFSSMTFSQRNSVLDQLLPDELKRNTNYKNHIVKLIRRHSMHQDKPSATAISFLGNFSFSDSSTRDNSINTADKNKIGSLVNGKWVLGDIFNRGTFGVIRKCFDIDDTSDEKAVKIIATHNSFYFVKRFETEALIWSLMQHENILKLQDVCLTNEYIFLVMPNVSGGCLYDIVKMWEAYRIPLGKRFEQILGFLKDLCSALEYIHSRGIYHGDLKLENCLVDSQHENCLLLCDFGMANFFEDYVKNNIHVSPMTRQILNDCSLCGRQSAHECPMDCEGFSFPDDEIGSLPYAAPELLNPEPHSPDNCCDIWAFGVIMYTLITLKLPFCHRFEPRVRLQIIRCQYDDQFYGQQLDTLSNTHIKNTMIDLLQSCLTLEPAKRPNSDAISKIIFEVAECYKKVYN